MTARGWMDGSVIPAEDYGNNHVFIAGVAEHPFKLLPIGTIEPRVIKAWLVDIVGPLGKPGIESCSEAVTRFDGLSPEMIGSTIEQDAESIHFESMKPIDAITDDLFIVPT